MDAKAIIKLFLFLFMDSVLVFLSWAVLSFPVSAQPYKQFIYPNFTASTVQLVEDDGAFLLSPNGTFEASISNTNLQASNYYFSVIHSRSGAIIWTANPNGPISRQDSLFLTTNGLSITDSSNNTVWSTPQLKSAVYALELLESGNLVLIDAQNVSLWESFDYPTDAIVAGQRLGVGQRLVGAVSEYDLSKGDYQIVVTTGDAVLQWNGMSYWKLSKDAKANKGPNVPASFLAMNGTGLFLFGGEGSTALFQVVVLGDSEFRIAKLGSNGKFLVKSFSKDSWVQEFSSPGENCRIPLYCGKLGLCKLGTCSCPAGFQADSSLNGTCVPKDGSFSLPSGCNTNRNNSALKPSISYLKLDDGTDYFANEFTEPVKNGVTLSYCQALCSQNCSCLGIFYGNGSGSCYILENQLGTIISSSTGNNDHSGYIKVLVGASKEKPNGKSHTKFPTAGLVVLPSGFLLFLAVTGFLCWKRNIKSGTRNSTSLSSLETINIPGLPVWFNYEELAAATDNFSERIGSGGFGAVYRGILRDKTIVAVKKINSLGVKGKMEFLTELAIIGSIRHVNLVRLKGFCSKGRQRFLVYEYMNKSSLDHTLFGNEPVLGWQERFAIALGTARGLAYLHSGCNHKIIHCDIKPENILLHDNLQVKISDFGLSKLLSPEQSNQVTTLRGTRGYLAPEWLTSNTISDKVDVFSYGMVLLEIVSGRRNCSLMTQTCSVDNLTNSKSCLSSSSSGSESRLVYFPKIALKMHEMGTYLDLADPRLEGHVTNEEVEKFVRIALCCIHQDPTLRPTMAKVVGMLEGKVALGVPNIQSLSFLLSCGGEIH